MADPYGTFTDTVSSPARKCFTISPHDTIELPIVPKAIRADGDGVIALVAIDSTDVVLHPVLKGERIDVRARLVKATGTSGQTTIIGYA